MQIKEQFNLVAKEYDSGRRVFIPCFDDYYINTTDLIASNIRKPRKVLDLGAGTGLLTMFWYQHFPEAEYILVDIADDMLTVAKERFKGLENVHYQNCDYSEQYRFDNVDTVISALSIHHLTDSKKQELFQNIYNCMPEDGIFVNYDQFNAASKELTTWYNSYWENRLENSALSENDLNLWRERRKLDKECSVEEEIKMLRDAGFSKVDCVYSYQKFSVIIAIK